MIRIQLFRMTSFSLAFAFTLAASSLAWSQTLNNGILEVVGGATDDLISVTTESGMLVARLVNSTTDTEVSFDPADVSSIELVGLEGDDVLTNLTDVSATLRGGAGDDVCVTNTEDDSCINIEEGGNDVYFLRGGSVTHAVIPGEIGFDSITVIGSVKEEVVTFKSSATRISGLSRIFLEGGDDRYFGEDNVSAPVIVRGGFGNDRLFGGLARNVEYLFGGVGDDQIQGGGGFETMYGDAGRDFITAGNGFGFGDFSGCFINGGAGRDRLTGSNGPDRIFGSGGNDVLFGGGGDDFLSGGLGDDFARGGTGNDVLRGQGGDDGLFGEEGDDVISGGPGDDELTGDSGDDVLRGGSGEDELDGGLGDDIIFGGPDNDELIGGPSIFIDGVRDGNDVLRGDAGNDLLDGSRGNDLLFGGPDDDTLVGGLGDDRLSGGLGTDVLDGGSGTNVLKQLE